jgi:SpoIID/LytB domain protein
MPRRIRSGCTPEMALAAWPVGSWFVVERGPAMFLAERFRTVRGLSLGVAGTMVASLTLVAAAPAHANMLHALPLASTVTISGHGWGHGRGMGQYGALGYAVDYGWSSAQILDHFYGGTTAGNVGNPQMTVELLAHSGRPLVVTGPGLMVNGTAVGAAAVRLTLSGSNVIAARGAGCGSTTWSKLGTYPASATLVRTTAAPTTLDNLLSTCESTGKRAYRGELAVVSSGGTQQAINHLPTESYLRGVVPHESPAYWGSLGGGKGMQALRAQAVAARSYALASTRPSGAHTCDTTSCQVYDGAGTKTSTTWTLLEQPLTDTAISTTAGVVRMSNGLPARTEFSSSTGGYTAGGAFPAVVDVGDSVAENPNHSWATTLTLSDIASSLGTGTITTMTVTARNGLGAGGGRVTNVRVVTAAGVVRDFSGDQVQAALGLNSNWFSISVMTLAQAQPVVKALYADLLLRPVDSSGLQAWSGMLAGGVGQSALVASLTSSREYVQLRVRQAYQKVLGRAPDAGGMATWRGGVLAGRVPVDDVQRRLYASQEFINRSGGTNQGYVAGLYRSILGRAPSSAEVASWVAKINQYGRGSVVDQIWFSPEAASARAGAYYLLFLKQAPDPAVRASWAQVLLAHGEGAVRTGIAGSGEYRLLALKRYP